MDVAPRYLAEARAELLNPEQRAAIDTALHDRQRVRALAEFQKFLDFALSDKVLTCDGEANLRKLGSDLGLCGERRGRHHRGQACRRTGAIREADSAARRRPRPPAAPPPGRAARPPPRGRASPASRRGDPTGRAPAACAPTRPPTSSGACSSFPGWTRNP